MPRRSCSVGLGKSRSSRTQQLSWQAIGSVEFLEQRVLLSAAQSYTFQNVDIGGGGYVDGVFYSPTQQNVVYARTDIGGLYKSVNDGQTWSQLLDFVGNSTSTSGNGTQQQLIGVLSFAIDPESPNNIYADVGEYSGSNGAVFYSTNAGATWSQTNLSFYVGGNSNGRGDGEQIAVDPNDSSIVYLGTNSAGLWKSTNAGHSFVQVSPAAFSPTSTTFVLFDPSTGTPGDATQTIYVGIDSTSSGTNLYQTTNGGKNWSQVTGTGTLPSGFLPGHATLSGGNLYLGYANAEAPNGSITNGGAFRYTPASATWANISPLVPVQNFSVTSLTRSGTTATLTTTNANGLAPGDSVNITGATPAAYDGTFIISGTLNSNAFTYTVPSGSDTAGGTINVQHNLGFGYDGVAADPQNPNTVVVASYDYYTGPDQMWRTVDANDPTPVWTEIYDYSTAANFGFNGYDTTRDTSNAPWVAAFGDGIGNWAGSIAINPFDSNQLMYGTGQGLWATNNLSNDGTNTQLTAPGSWYFPDTGIEFTAVGGLAAPASGVPLFSAMGDIFGFAHTTISSSPAQGAAGSGSTGSADEGGGVAAIVGTVNSASQGYFSVNDGDSFTEFPTTPGGGSTYGEDTIAVSANGATIVWSPSGLAPYYSTNDGTTWTAATGGMAPNGQVYADRINPNDFYYRVNNDVYFSNNGGVSFTLASSSVPSGGQMAVNPLVSGDLWIADSTGVFHSTNFGSSFAGVTGSLSSTGGVIALGAPAPGKTAAAIYVFGTVAGFLGVYRSDDGGSTWTQINNIANQWGGLVQTMAADPNVFGRIYIGINGRGIIMGNPSSNLPAGFKDTDVSAPGNPGWAVSSTTLSTGSVNTTWLVNGGGAGLVGNTFSVTSLSRTAGALGTIATATTSAANGLHVGDSVTISGASPPAYDGTFAVTSILSPTEFTYTPLSGTDVATGTITAATDDQFNFAAEPITGDSIVSAQLLSLSDGDGSAGTPEAGIMYRAGTAAGDPFVALVQSTNGTITFESRASEDGTVARTQVSGIPVGSEFFEIIRSGDSFGAFYSADGRTWTQIGANATDAGIPSAAEAGLAVTSDFNSQFSAAKFAAVDVTLPPPPQITSAASQMLIAGQSADFTVTASDPGQSISFTETGVLPSGLSFLDNGNGTATLTGIPGALAGGTYKLTFSASNGSTTGTQTFSLAILAPGVITSPSAASFVLGKSASFNVTATGFPSAATIFETGMLPAGLTLTTSGAHSAEIHGIPAAGTAGTYHLMLFSLNGLGPLNPQSFTLVVDQPPVFSTPAAATFVAGLAKTFTINAAGVGPDSLTLTSSVAVPGLTFTDMGNGLATFTGAATTGGTYHLTLTAANGTGATAQAFFLTVDQAPTFTTGATATFTAGTFSTFAINTTGYPTATTYLEAGPLPAGVTLLALGPQKAELHGTPAAGTGGTYTITLLAHNGVAPVAEQSFTLIVDQAPVFTSAAAATFTFGAAGDFTVTSNGVGAIPAYELLGTPPAGVSLIDNGNGTASLLGTPTAAGTFKLTFTANNGATTTKQIFTLTVDEAATITSAAGATFTPGKLNTFTITASAYPLATTYYEIGALPTGVSLAASGTSAAILRGTPASGSAGTYTLTLIASNAITPVDTQPFTLIVSQ